MRLVKYKFREHINQKGGLVVVEGIKDIPFAIKRIYYMYGMEEETVRGEHAHKNLEQIIICIKGSCKIMLEDRESKIEYVLNRKDEGIYLKHNIWRKISDCQSGTILLVLAIK